MSILTIGTFETGKYKLTVTQFNTADLQACIDRYENRTMSELFGVELLALYTQGIIDADPIYEFLRDAFIVEINKNLVVSTGVVDMLAGIVWAEFQRDIYTQSTSFGQVKSKGENSEGATFSAASYQSKRIEAESTFIAIQEYIEDNLDVYPTFNGVPKRAILPF
jgi:hypothetical protein